MRLKSVSIKGYRLINEEVRVHCDKKITVILAANDHGKTNFLHALQHLNEEKSFDDEDLNWDCEGDAENLPCIRFELALDGQDRANAKLILDYSIIGRIAKKEFEASLLRFENLSQKTEELRTELNELSGIIEAEDSPAEAKETARKRIKLASSEIKELEKMTGGEKMELLEFAATSIEASYVVAKMNAENALSLGLAEAQESHSQLTTEAQNALASVAKLNRKLAQARNNNEQERIKSLSEQITTLEGQAQQAGAKLESYPFAEVLTDLEQYVKSDLYRGRLRDNYLRKPTVELPETVPVQRKGLKGELETVLPEEIDTLPPFVSLVFSLLPRVELVSAVDRFSDAVSREEIEKDEFEFMRGVFYYAGLDKSIWDQIFVQNDYTQKRLQSASDKLNETLRSSWSQGSELKFQLSHDSKSGKIELRISDPAVSNRLVRASRRSTGFTHFFTLKTILHSRQTESPASSYLWLFDEPGMYLHPYGQHDLLQVMETLALTNQIIYSTHSIFLINKNFPTRHRLMLKSTNGTKLDGKPHQGHWKAAIDSLGLALPGTILFAEKMLLVEGDSDPILLNTALLKLIEASKLNADLNSLAIVSTGDSKNADAIIRILSEAPRKPKLVALFDGDKGGSDRKKSLATVMDAFDVETIELDKDCELEDYMLGPDSIFVRAVSEYVAEITGKDPAAMLEKFQRSYSERFKDVAASKISGLAAWSREEGKAIGQLKEEPSPVGIARKYQLLLVEEDIATFGKDDLKRLEKLAETLVKKLKLPTQTLREKDIVETR